LRFSEQPVAGVFAVEPEPVEDERGHFARAFCAEEFAARGLDPRVAQCSVSFNRRRGTLRGLHYQSAPHEEAKLVRCIRGAIFDVAVDLRPESPTFRRWVGVELTPANGLALYVPPGVAHGFQTLADESEVWYQISVPYAPDHGRGVRFDDPAFGVEWPEPVTVVSERDRSYPDFAA